MFFSVFSKISLRQASLVLLSVVAIALNSCSLDRFKAEATQVPQMVASVGTDPSTFNYALNQAAPNVFGYIYEGLITSDGMTGEIIPAQAESWEVSDDNLRITFTLREGLKWSDGEPLTADDVVFTFNDVYLNEEIPAPTRDVLRIGESGALPTVRKVGDRQIEFVSPEPFAPLLLYGGGAPILPAHKLREAVETKNSAGEPLFLSTWGTGTDPGEIVGNGPYVMVSYSPAERVVMRRNPYYWQQDEQGNPKPYVERFVWQIIENTDTALLEFRSGGSDLIEISASTFQLLKKEENRGNFSIYQGGPDTSALYFCFNLNQASRNGQPIVDPIKSRWFNTLEFRQAVAHAIDRPTMINNIFLGLGEAQNSPIPVQSVYYLSPQEGLKTYDYNLEQAKELLTSAGFQYNSAGQLLDAEGNRVQFTLLTNSGGRRIATIGAQIKQDLAQIGMQVDFQPIDFNTLINRLGNTFEWDAYLGGITASTEPHGWSAVWALDGSLHTFNQAPTAGQPPVEGQQFADWEREIANLYVKGSQVLDEAGRREIYAQAQQLMQEHLPFIYLVNALDMAAVRNTVQGIEYSSLGGPLWNLPDLRVAEN
ncbi:ABC transporter substrate-binding protein [Leptolyngbya sp. FACHB-671]|uniref:ABC transporter substrate-binding protein n=1 Tax=Leptolyngbya sp. FACHB-671 TaxID=2692812 RepID=UPI00168383DD|nr:ABC transporter substrate-binding protein [Leptolyngbya sp. FACHB-671]MBD2069164.1 ABC transporter substrate-binding protein [Leptolyngbya sp. FACHB-671]